MIKPKRCPWCFKKEYVETIEINIKDSNDKYYLVKCSRCGAGLKSATKTLEKAIEYWNDIDFGPH